MRKFQQAYILELLATLAAAHRELEAQKSRDAAVALLTDCQALAVKTGEFIEGLEGEGTATVGLLEAYCERLYEVSQAEEPRRNVNILRRALKKIEDSLRRELPPNKIEMVFFPYKASMFDTFESIWRAAQEDPRCDAYVVPIPYFDKNPDGSTGDVHFEGDLYPPDIPVTDWRSYDVESRRPDVIFIHNPYDEVNYVTTVHPNYYARRLRELTDLLVYIPYFVSIGTVGSLSVTTAGCIHAHKTFVQSEAIRQTYMRVYQDYVRESGFEALAAGAKDKFLALGSPKFDAVCNTTRDDYPLPEGWAERLGGGEKPVVLLSTTVAPLLADNGRALDKLEAILASFAARDDVALWWRPHPLNASSLRSLRPRLLRRYEALVAGYKRAGKGVYDDTPDSQRAIAWSSAYYGDGGSILGLYLLSGKPVLLQNNDVDVMARENPLGFVDALVEDGAIIAPLRHHNGLLRVDVGSGEASILGAFPGQCAADGLYRGLVRWGDKLYFAPAAADSIAVYDTATGVFDALPLPAVEMTASWPISPQFKFLNVFCHRGNLFFVPQSWPAILRLDAATGRMETCTAGLDHPLLASDQVIPFYSVLREENHLLLPTHGGVLAFNMDTCTATMHAAGERGDEDWFFSGICAGEDCYWLTPLREGPVVKWCPGTGGWTAYATYPKGFQPGWHPFCAPVYAAGAVWLLPNIANMALRLDAADGQMEELPALRAEGAKPGYYYSGLVEGKLAGLFKSGSVMRILDPVTRQVKNIAVTLPAAEDGAFRQAAFAPAAADTLESYILWEAPGRELSVYCDRVAAGGLTSQAQIAIAAAALANPGTAGQAIFDYCMRALRP